MSHPRHGSQFPGTGGGAVLFIRRLSVKVPIASGPVFVSGDKAPRGSLTTRYHGYIIAGKSDKGQDAALRVEMGNSVYNLRNAWAAVSKAAEGNPAKVGLTHEKVAVLWACRDYPVQLTPAETSRLVFRAKIVRG